MEEYFHWDSVEDYLEEYFAPIPGGLEHMLQHGIWQDETKEPHYVPYEQELDQELVDRCTVDRLTGILYTTDGGEKTAVATPPGWCGLPGLQPPVPRTRARNRR